MSKKKGKGKQTQHHQVATKGGDKETLSPLQELIHSLYTTSESRLVAKDKRSKPETIKKCVNEIEKVVRTILKESKKEEWQKHVIRLNLAVQMSTGHGAALSKKIVSIFFTFLIDEVRRFWREYGITEDSVHDDYVCY